MYEWWYSSIAALEYMNGCTQAMMHINVRVVVLKHWCTRIYEWWYLFHGAHSCMSGGTQTMVYMHI